MSNRTILPLAFLSVLAIVLCSGCGNVEKQAKEKKKEQATYEGKRIKQLAKDLTIPSLHPIERRKVAIALVKIGPAAVPALIGALKDKDGYVRQSAAYALGRIGPVAKDAVPALQAITKNDPERAARKAAAMALKKIQGK